jgi:alpha-beta hydrolase superfamily lysophospholipase
VASQARRRGGDARDRRRHRRGGRRGDRRLLRRADRRARPASRADRALLFPPDAGAAAYERYAVPETGQIFYEAGFTNFHLHPPTEVHFKNADRSPLLIVGAGEDHTVPASLAQAAYKRYEKSPAKTDYLEFEGRPHLHMAAPDWQEVAEAVDSWLEGVLDALTA